MTSSNTDATMPTPTAETPAATESIFKAATFIAVLTLISKALGFIRDWQIFHVFGASLATDAYFAAVQLPWYSLILVGGLGGPFHSAVVALFSKWVQPGQPPGAAAIRKANQLLTVVGLVFMAIAVGVWVYATPIMQLFLGSQRPELLALSAQHLRIMAPVLFFGGWIGVFYGLLNVAQHYFWPSMAPAVMNVVMIGALALTPATPEGTVLAWATLIGGGLQLLAQLPTTWLKGFNPLKFGKAGFAPLEKSALKGFGELVFPMLLGTTIGQLLVFVDLFFVNQLAEGGWSAIVLSNRLLQLPIGVLQTAMLVPLFPRFGRAVADKNWAGLRTDLANGVVTLWIIGAPMVAVLWLAGQPLVAMVFQHGEFDSSDTAMVALALSFQALQILPYFARDTFTRVFYAMEDSLTPLWVSLLAIAVKFACNWVFVGWFDLGGITLSTSVITLVNMVLLGGLLSAKHGKQVGGFGLKYLGKRLWQIVLASVLFGVGLWAGQGVTPVVLDALSLTLPTLVQWGVGFTVGLLLGAVLYVVALSLLKVSEMTLVTQRVQAMIDKR